MSVVVEQYNSEWPFHFEKIKGELEAYLKGIPLVSIEHVGSTSIPGLAAKPIIDTDVIVARESIQPAIDALVGKGHFTYLGELGIVDRHALKDRNQSPPRNIYVCVEGAFQVRNHLGIRNTLRSNPELRDEYGAIKLRLAAQGMNIIDYVEAKSEVIQRILKIAGLLSQEELEAIEQANMKNETFGATRTERLLLREFMLRDAAGYYELESKEEIVRYQTWGCQTEEQAHKEVVKIIQDSCVIPRKHIELAVEHEGKWIGRVGANITLEDKSRDPPSRPHANLWFSFLPKYHGKGFATEAMTAFVGLLKSPMELEIECDPRNIGSWKLAERLGFEKISLWKRHFECKGEWVDSLIYQKIV